MPLGTILREFLPGMNRRRRPVADRFADAGDAGGRLLRRAWGVTITALVAVDLVMQAAGMDNRWSRLVDACLKHDGLVPHHQHPAPPLSRQAAPSEAVELHQGQRR